MAHSSGINNVGLGNINRGLLFRLIATRDGITRAELTEATGLSKMAVSYIIADFLGKNLVDEVKDSDAPSVRKPMRLHLTEAAPKLVGVLIRREYVAAALCDCKLNILRSEFRPLTPETDTVSLLDALFSVTDAVLAGQTAVGIGIASIGPVDTAQGCILNPPGFYNIRDIPILDHFRSRYHLPVALEYHYNCIALAEKFYGAGIPYHNIMLLSSPGGGRVGIITGDQLYGGFTGLSSEFGHLCVDIHGPLCECGNRGCLGRYLHFAKGDDAANRNSVRLLASVLPGLCHVINPDALIIGGELDYLSDSLLNELQSGINARMITKTYRRIRVLRASRAEQAELSSCAVTILDRMFKGELPLDIPTDE